MSLLQHFLQSSKTEWQKKKPGLERISEACAAFGNPQEKFPSIHLAGTNGKGSTAAMLQSVFTEAGYKVGLFTSPHLVRVNERFRIGRKEITDRELEEILDIIHSSLSSSGLTGGSNVTSEKMDSPIESGNDTLSCLSFFELCTLIAFLYFEKQKVDLAIIEVGLGGRLDSTNIINPLVSVITEIGLDHTEVLGETITEIAREKAGIIKPKVPVVCGASDPKAIQVIQKAAAQNKSKIFMVGANNSLPLQGSLNLLGKYQQQNAELALQVIEVLKNQGWKILEEAIPKGLANVSWPGRFEIIQKNLPIILDGAHNPQGVRALVESIKFFTPSLVKEGSRGRSEDLTSPQPSPCQRRGGYIWKILFSAASDKNVGEMLKALSEISSEIILCEMENSRSINPVLIQKQYPELPLENGGKVKEAFLNAKKNLQEGQGLLVTGSLYWVGEVKQVLSFEKG